MKNKILLFVGLFLVLFVSACTTSGGTPQLELNTYTYDMGEVEVDDGLVEKSFTITNTGDALLNISYVSTSCGCTTAEVDKNELLAGETAQLTVVYDPQVHADLRGKLKRIIYIQSNDPNNEELELELIAYQVAHEESSEHQELPENHEDDDHHEEIDEHADNLKDFEISPFQTAQRIKSEDVKLLDVREQFEYDENHIDGTLLLSVNDITQESLDALGLEKDDEIIIYCRSGRRSAIAHELLEELGYTNTKSMSGGIIHWMEEKLPVESGTSVIQNIKVVDGKSSSVLLEVNSYDFGLVELEKGVFNTTFQIFNDGAGDLELSSISTSCGCTTATLDKNTLKQGEGAELTVFFDPNFHEEPVDKFSRTVFIETNDPNNPEIEVVIWADIIGN